MNSIKQRYYDRMASNLLFVGLFLAFGVLLVGPLALSEDAASRRTSTSVGFAIAFVFLAYQYYCIRQGQRWAKRLLVITFFAALLLFALDFQNVLHRLNSPLKVANNVLGYLIQASAIFLIFRYKFAKDEAQQGKRLPSLLEARSRQYRFAKPTRSGKKHLLCPWHAGFIFRFHPPEGRGSGCP